MPTAATTKQVEKQYHVSGHRALHAQLKEPPNESPIAANQQGSSRPRTRT
ncbi:MAG TPA: hypothetical protein VGR35_03065 [Tepidisphaeraceae bacterium]|nr:hypothetical protein [Tepidisphaeraceae bacterium]